MRENTDQKNSEYGHFSRSEKLIEISRIWSQNRHTMTTIFYEVLKQNFQTNKDVLTKLRSLR